MAWYEKFNYFAAARQYKICVTRLIISAIILNIIFFMWMKNNNKAKAIETRTKNFTKFVKLITPEYKVNDEMADFLYQNTRVLCWVLTNSKNYYKRARHVRKTWGKRCNKFLLMGPNNYEGWDSIALPVEEQYRFLWLKTKAAFRYIYENYKDEADWFLKADDDTYVIMENLRYFLYPYDPQTPIVFGQKLSLSGRTNIKHMTYMSGGAGYVLSKKALTLFYKFSNSSRACKTSNLPEDYYMSNCLRSLGVILGDSRDEYGWNRFYSVNFGNLLVKQDRNVWLWTYQYYKAEKICCSEYTISFHYVNTGFMYLFEFLLYTVRKYGIVGDDPMLPKKLMINATMQPPLT